MWAIFVVIPAAVGAVSAIFSLTGGGSFVVAAVATSEWTRRKGHRAGEGPLSRRANHTYYGVEANEDSEFHLNQDLGRLAGAVPSLFEKHMGLKFDFTKSEGDFLKEVLRPAMAAVDELETVKEFLGQQEQITEEQVVLYQEVHDRLYTVARTVASYLDMFPKSRVKKAAHG